MIALPLKAPVIDDVQIAIRGRTPCWPSANLDRAALRADDILDPVVKQVFSGPEGFQIGVGQMQDDPGRGHRPTPPPDLSKAALSKAACTTSQAAATA